MPKVKKLAAVILAILMIFGSVSLMVSAETSDGNLTVRTEFLRQQADGQWVATEKYKAGETVKARVYLGTDYYVGDGSLLFFYNKDFFEAESTDINFNSVYSNYIAKSLSTMRILNDDNVKTFVEDGLISDEYAEKNGAILVYCRLPDVGFKYDASKWFCEFELKVKSDAEGKGYLEVAEGTISSIDNVYGIFNVSKCEDGEGALAITATSMYCLDIDVDISGTKVENNWAELFTNYVTVTFNGNEGLFNGQTTVTVDGDAGDELTAPVPTRANYKLLGWTAEGEATPHDVTEYPTEDTVYTANWEVLNPDEKTLAFKTEIFRNEDGEWIKTDRVKRGEDVKARLYIDASYFTGSGDVLLFYDNGFFTDSYPDSSVSAVMNEETGSSAAINKATATVSKLAPTAKTISDLVKNGHLTQDFVNSHTAITFNFYNGSNDAQAKVNALSGDYWYAEFDLKVADTASGEGDFFVGEDTICGLGEIYNYTNVYVSNEGEFASDALNLWQVDVTTTVESNPVTIDSKIIFDANGGILNGNETLTKKEYTGEIGTAFEYAVPEATKTGSEFAGWVDEEGKAVEVPAEFGYDDVTLYASWKTEYTITYKVEGQDDKVDSYEVGKTIVKPADPTAPEGYKFDGWTPSIPDKMPAESLVVEATFKAKAAKATFDPDGGKFEDNTTESKVVNGFTDDPLTAPAVSKEGYVFFGWTPSVPEKMAPGENTYKAAWTTATGTKYTVNTYVMDTTGKYPETPSTTQTLYGETGTEVTAVVNEEFDGFGLDEEKKDQIKGVVTADGKLVLNVYYAREKYDITFKFNDGTTADKKNTYYYGSTVVAPEIPVWEGHTTTGWQPDIQKVATETATYELTWSVNDYNVIYYVDGEEYKTVEYKYGADVTAETEPLKTGYEFSGWFTDEELKTAFDTTTMPANDIEVYGEFSAKKIKVSFYMSKYAEEPDFTVDVPFDTEIGKPDKNPVPGDEEVFIGWYEKNDPNTIYTDSLGIMDSEEPKEFYPAFREIGNAPYTIEIYEMGTDGKYGEAEEIPCTDGKIGETASIEGKVTVEDGFKIDTKLSVISGTIEEGKDLVLKVYLERQKYTLTTYVDGEVYTKVEYFYGANTDVKDAAKEGYIFKNWTDKVEDGVKIDAPATMPANDVDLYAEFIENTYQVIYMVKKAEDEAFTEDSRLGTDFGKEIYKDLDPEAIPEGYTYDGPYTDETCSTRFAGGTMPAENVKLYYIFRLIKNTYTFDATGGTFPSTGNQYAEDEFEYGEEPEYKEDPVWPGHTFCGWGPSPDGNEFKRVATWEENQYDVTYIADGEVFKKLEDILYGDDFEQAIIAEEPTKEGYNFTGWKDADGKTPADYFTMPDKSLEFVAQFEIKEITIVTDVDGVETEYKFNYGEKVDIPEPSVNGKIFKGWLPEMPETAPDADEPVKVTAEFENYTLLARYYVKVEGGEFGLVEYKTYEVGETIEKKLENTAAAEEYNLDNYAVEGPFADAALTTTFDADVMPAKAVNLYYKLIPGTVDITFDANGGKFENGDEEKTVPTTVDTIPQVEEPVKEGYTFKGWTPDLSAATEVVTYVATWDISDYSITYMNGNAEVETFTGLVAGSDLEVTDTIPEKNDYVFVGWADEDGKSPYDYDSMPANDLVFYAQFENAALDLFVRYFVKIDGEEFRVIEYKSCVEGDAVETNLANTAAAEEYDLSKYTVDGPYTDATLSTKFTAEVMPGNNLELYYKLIPANITLTFELDGGKFEDESVKNPMTVAYGTTPVVPDPVKDGFEFIGWDSEIGAAEEDKTYTATWEKLIVKNDVVYKNGDEIVETFTDVEAGDDIPVTGTEPEKPGYIFDGWKDADGKAPEDYETMPEKALEFQPTWVEAEQSFVKLVPLDENSTAMIERDKVVETYNEEVVFNSHSGLSTIAPITEEYGDYTKDPETYFVYGLAQGLTPDDLADYVKVLGDGRMEIECLRSGRLGTGSVVKVYDRKGTEDTTDDALVEQFYIIIFGDVNGDSVVTSSDYNAMYKSISGEKPLTAVYNIKAGDLNNDTVVSSTDYDRLYKVIDGTNVINQINGLTAKKVVK